MRWLVWGVVRRAVLYVACCVVCFVFLCFWCRVVSVLLFGSECREVCCDGVAASFMYAWALVSLAEEPSDAMLAVANLLPSSEVLCPSPWYPFV